MIERVDISPAEFDRRRDRLRSRWSSLIESLKAGAFGDVFSVCLRADENTGLARKLARQSIYAIARHHGIRVKLSSSKLIILVMKNGEMEPDPAGLPTPAPNPLLDAALL